MKVVVNNSLQITHIF